MLQANRLDEITSIITVHKYISVEELSIKFDVSGETIRRDLKILEKQNILKRTYGGAYLAGSHESDVSIQVRKGTLVRNKQQIAALCQQFIKAEDTVFLDSSTTSLEIAKLISHLPVTVITHSLFIVNYLASCEAPRVVLLGGILDTVNMCFTGKTTLGEFKNFYASKAFISCRSISAEHGVMDSNEQLCQIRSFALSHSEKAYLVADHTKFDNNALCKIADIADFAALITDTEPNASWQDYFDKNNISLFFPK